MKKIVALLAILTVITLLAGTTSRVSVAQQTTAVAMTAATSIATTAADPLGGATTFAKADKPTNVTLMLDWTPNTNHLGVYVAQAKGFYQEANLTVEIQQPGDVQVEQIVGTGKAQFGISYEEQATYSRAANVPII